MLHEDALLVNLCAKNYKAVVLLVHMYVGASETRTIVRTNYLMEIIAMVMVNVTMEFDVKI